MLHENGLQKQQISKMIMPPPSLLDRLSAPRHRRIPLRPISLQELDSISSLFIYPTNVIPTNLLHNKNNIPARPFNAYIIRYYWNTVCCQFLTSAEALAENLLHY